MGRNLEQILVQEDPHMVAEARKLAAKMLLDIEEAEHLIQKEGTTRETESKRYRKSRR